MCAYVRKRKEVVEVGGRMRQIDRQKQRDGGGQTDRQGKQLVQPTCMLISRQQTGKGETDRQTGQQTEGVRGAGETGRQYRYTETGWSKQIAKCVKIYRLTEAYHPTRHTNYSGFVSSDKQTKSISYHIKSILATYQQRVPKQDWWGLR